MTYDFTKESNKKYHVDICTEAKKGEVTGVVSKKDDKLIITVESVKFDE